MELSSLSENVVPVPYERGGEILNLQVNIDGFTPEFWRTMKAKAEARFKKVEGQVKAELREAQKKVQPKVRPKKKLTKAQMLQAAEDDLRAEVQRELFNIELRAKRLEAERETNIEFLIPYILKGWDATENGVPVQLTAEVLNGLPPQAVQAIFDVCVKAARTVKKRADEEDVETSESTPSGSRALHAVGQTG
jgi:hypothetical protein